MWPAVGWAAWTIVAVLAVTWTYGCRRSATKGNGVNLGVGASTLGWWVLTIVFLVTSLNKLHLAWLAPLTLLFFTTFALAGTPLISALVLRITRTFLALVLIGVPEAPADPLRRLREAAELGNPDAQTNLGLMYTNGQGIERDFGEALKWFHKAAEQGNAEAQNSLGVAFSNALGTAQDPTEAVRWLRKAAEQGHAAAQYNLGLAYANGLGIAKDPAEAVKWYRKAAAQGIADAQHNLGVAYANGSGIAKDLDEAEKWLREAEEHGAAGTQHERWAGTTNGSGSVGS